MKIPRYFSFVLTLVLLLGASPLARAHHGFESAVQVRLLEKQTTVFVHFAPGTITHLLGADAPRAWTDQSLAALQPRLLALAPAFLALRAGEQTLTPVSVTTSLEVGGQIAFTLKYPAAPAGLFSVEAAYFKDVGPEFTGTLTVFGPPENPAERHGPAVGTLELSPSQRVLTIPTRAATPSASSTSGT